MDQFLHTLFVFLHILGVVLFVGPQFFLAFAWVPASRGIADLPTRVKAMRTITDRFLFIGGAGLILALLAGTYLVSTWRDYYGMPDSVDFTSVRFGVVFIVKMILFSAMLVAVGLHTFLVGPKLVNALDKQGQGGSVSDKSVRRLRLQSMSLSITGLVLVIAIMVMGVMLNTAQWSLG
ncbi:MAG TPA: hypothetical protein QGF35_09240 [Dehalococcoidia bacterium]|nr:hypothetical protein [Dehalococcoidia bacterium]